MHCASRLLPGESFSAFPVLRLFRMAAFRRTGLRMNHRAFFIRNICRRRYSRVFEVAEINDEYHGNDDIDERHDEESAQRCLPHLPAALSFQFLQRVFSASHVQAHMKSLLWAFSVRIMVFSRWRQTKNPRHEVQGGEGKE